MALAGLTGTDALSARHGPRSCSGDFGQQGAVLVIDETGFLKKGNVFCGIPVYRLGRQDHELSDWCVCSLCLSAGSCFCGSRPVSSQGLDFGSVTVVYSLCPKRRDVCDPTRQMIERSLRSDHSLNGLLSIVFMSWERSRWGFGMLERATSWVTGSIHGE